MEYILALNAGSTSLKGSVYDYNDIMSTKKNSINSVEPLMSFRWDAGTGKCVVKCESGKTTYDAHFLNHTEAFYQMLSDLKNHGIYESQIIFVVSRIVNGGKNLLEDFIEVTPDTLIEFKKNLSMAPAHNEAAYQCAELCKKTFINAYQYFSFDTAFHKTIPTEKKIYAIPWDLYENGIQVYGAHGISFQDVTNRTSALMKIPKENLNIIIFHLGGGCSAACVKNGKSIDTTMGYTPTDGIMMASRSGHIDPGIFPDLIKEYGSIESVIKVLNKESGFKGLTGSADMRDVEENAKDGDYKSEIAIKKYYSDCRKVLGAFLLELEYNVDAIVFTAGTGEKAKNVVRAITQGLNKIGVILSEDESMLTIDESPIKVLQLEADEEFALAKKVIDI